MSQSLIFLTRAKQIDTLRDHDPHLLSEGHIIALDLDVTARLDMLGYTYITTTDLIPMSDADSLLNLAHEIAETWFESISDEVTVHEVNAAWLERHELDYAFREGVFARAVFERAQAYYNAVSAVLFENHQVPTVHANLSPDTANAVWRFLAEQAGLALTIIPSPRTTRTHENPMPRWKQAWSAIRGIVRNPLTWRMLSPVPSRGAILFIVAINETFRYAAVIKGLRETMGPRLMPLALGARTLGRVDIPAYKLTLGALALPPTLRYRRYIRLMRAAFEKWKAAPYQGNYPELFANPYLHFQFEAFFVNRLPHALSVYSDARTVFTRLRPAAVATSAVPNLHQTAVLEAARRLDIPAATLPHSGVVTDPRITVFGDVAIAWTRDYEAVWKDALAPIIVTGLPKTIVTDGYVQAAEALSAHSLRRTVLAIVSTLSVGLFPFADYSKHRATLEMLAHVPSHLAENVQVHFKLHPKWDYQYVYQQASTGAVPNTIEIMRDVSIHQLMREADVVLLINVPSSASLLALVEEKPLLIVDTASRLGSEFVSPQWSESAVIRNNTDMWRTVEDVLFSAERREDILEANRRYWAWLIGNCDSPLVTLQSELERIAALRQ